MTMQEMVQERVDQGRLFVVGFVTALVTLMVCAVIGAVFLTPIMIENARCRTEAQASAEAQRQIEEQRRVNTNPPYVIPRDHPGPVNEPIPSRPNNK